MISFSITSYSIKKMRLHFACGKIEINDFVEEFDMPLDWWSKEDYEKQWHNGLERIKSYSKSCLVTRIKNPCKGPFIDWWLLYKEGNTIFIRNEILFREEYENLIGSAEFTVESCYGFIPDRGPRDLDNGMRVSEWQVRLDAKYR